MKKNRTCYLPNLKRLTTLTVFRKQLITLTSLHTLNINYPQPYYLAFPPKRVSMFRTTDIDKYNLGYAFMSSHINMSITKRKAF